MSPSKLMFSDPAFTLTRTDRFDLFNEVGKSGGTLCDFGGVGGRIGRKASLVERVGANSSASYAEASNGSKEDKATS